MKKTTALGMAALSLLVACGEGRVHPDGARTPADVKRDVNVIGDEQACSIQPIPDIYVNNKNSANIVWNISPSNKFEFDTQGIAFVSGKPDPLPSGNEITRTNASPTTWQYHDRNTIKGGFGYAVHVKVKGPNGKACDVLDPAVYNDGSCDPLSGSC